MTIATIGDLWSPDNRDGTLFSVEEVRTAQRTGEAVCGRMQPDPMTVAYSIGRAGVSGRVVDRVFDLLEARLDVRADEHAIADSPPASSASKSSP